MPMELQNKDGVIPMNPYMTGVLKSYRSSEKRFTMLAFPRVHLGFVLTVSAFLLCNLSLLLIPSASMAQGLILTPRLLVEEEYSDNWRRSEEDEEEFWVTRIWAGFNLGYGAYTGGRLSVNLDVSLGPQFHYSPDNDADASSQDYVGGNASLALAYRATPKVTTSLVNTFTLTREPAGTDQFSDSTDRELYWRNQLTPSIRYDMAEKGYITLSYLSDVLLWVSNTDEGQEDSTSHGGDAKLVYFLNSRNHLGLNGNITRRSYDGPNSNYYDYSGRLSFWHEFNSYFSGRGSVGWKYRDYDGDDLDNQTKVVFDAGLTGKTDRTMLDLSVIRDLVSFTTDDEYFTATRVNLFLQRRFLETIRPYVAGYYQYSDYQNSTREDDTYSVDVGCGYRFFRRLVEFSVEYGYRERDSNEPGRDYEENRVFFRLSFGADVSDYVSRMISE
jgi:hypothetical protein